MRGQGGAPMKRNHWLMLIIALLVAAWIVTACNGRNKPPHENANRNSNTPVVQNHDQGDVGFVPKLDTQPPSRDSGVSGTVAYGQLPKDAQAIIRAIQLRQSFAYNKDGSVFQNREHILPNQPKGYYREYTVVTSGADNRGPRRIIAGQGVAGDVASSGEYYYTSDHYRTFYKVKP